MTVKETDNKQKDGRHKLTGAGPGRPKGSTNKFTDLKQAFLDTFQDKRIGGSEGMTKVFSKNDYKKIEFFKLIAKMLPSNVSVDGDLNITFQASEKFNPKVGDEKK